MISLRDQILLHEVSPCFCDWGMALYFIFGCLSNSAFQAIIMRELDSFYGCSRRTRVFVALSVFH